MDLLSFLFPRRCVGCGEIGAYLCPDCINAFVPLVELYCPGCRQPSYAGHTHSRCQKTCDLDGLLSGYQYSGLMKKVMTRFKYTFVKDLATTLGELFISRADYPLLFRQSWTLIPVPLHVSRRKWRGFNQAEVLASELATNWQWPLCTNILVRCKKTSPQMSLSGKKRRQNLARAFEVTAKRVPASILLIDDVATTCSTLNECAKVLRQAGAKEVWGLTLAQALPR